MKKLMLIPIAVAFIVSCTAKTTANKQTTAIKTVARSPTATGVKNLTPEMLAEGKTIYGNSCAKCHDLPDPAKYSDTKWVGIINAMAPKAHLTTAQSDLVYDYVTSKN